MKQVIMVFFVCLGILMSLPGVSAAESLRFTLEEAVAAGLAANPGVDSAKQTLEKSQLGIKAARGYFLPSLTLQSSASRYTQKGDIMTNDELDRDIYTGEVRVSQVLFDGFSTLSKYAKSKIQADADKARLDQSRLDLIYHIQQNFLSLLKSKEDLGTIRDEIKRIESQLEASKVFYKSGFSPHIDVLRNEVALARAQSEQIKIRNSIKNYSTQLNTYLALPFDQDIAYEGDLRSYNFNIGYNLGSAVATALSKRPDLNIGEKSVAIAEQEARGTMSQYYPRVTLDYSKTKQYNDYKDYYYSSSSQDIETIGVSLSWNLFDGGTTTYTHLGDLRQITALKRELEDSTAAAKASIVQVFTDIDDAKKLIDLAIETRKSALENYNMAKARYKIRIGSLTDLLDAQKELTQAESDISNAYMQYQITRAALFYNMGIENAGLE